MWTHVLLGMGLFTDMDRNYGERESDLVFVKSSSPLVVAMGDVVRGMLLCKLVGLPFACKDTQIKTIIIINYQSTTEATTPTRTTLHSSY